MLQGERLAFAGDEVLFDSLIKTRAVEVLETLDTGKLNRLKRIAYGGSHYKDPQIADKCCRMGILVQTGEKVRFSSPVL